MKTIKTLTLGLVMTALGLSATAQRNWGCDSDVQQTMLEPVSLYQENWKQYDASKDARYLTEAYPFWKTIVTNCPKQSKNLYTRGAIILKYMAEKAEGAKRDSLINELMNMYDIRIANYGEASKVTAMKAMDLEALKGAAGLQEYYGLYSSAVKMEGGLEAAYLVKYMEATINYVRAGYAEPTLVVDNYDIASDLLEEELRKNAADSVKASTIRGYIAGVEAAFSPYASCEQLVDIYGKKFEADPENVDLLKKITNIMTKKGCTTQPLFFSATENLYRLEPSPTTAMRMGTMCLRKEQYSKAIEYLNDAVKGVEDKDKYTAYIMLGTAYYGAKNFGAARTAYNKAAEVDGSKGEPYRMIAQVYAASSNSATDDNVSGRSVYWAAVDKANKAKAVDPTPENVEAANALISRYSAYFPKQTDAFMAGLENGQRFVVPGWIGEATTVRTR